MKFEEKYAKNSDKANKKQNKVVISDDAFALGEQIEKLIREIKVRW